MGLNFLKLFLVSNQVEWDFALYNFSLVYKV